MGNGGGWLFWFSKKRWRQGHLALHLCPSVTTESLWTDSSMTPPVNVANLTTGNKQHKTRALQNSSTSLMHLFFQKNNPQKSLKIRFGSKYLSCSMGIFRWRAFSLSHLYGITNCFRGYRLVGRPLISRIKIVFVRHSGTVTGVFRDLWSKHCGLKIFSRHKRRPWPWTRKEGYPLSKWPQPN